MLFNATFGDESGCGSPGALRALQFSYISARRVQNELKFVLNSGHNSNQSSLNFVVARILMTKDKSELTLHILKHYECNIFGLDCRNVAPHDVLFANGLQELTKVIHSDCGVLRVTRMGRGVKLGFQDALEYCYVPAREIEARQMLGGARGRPFFNFSKFSFSCKTQIFREV